MVWRVTPTRSASSACVISPRANLRDRMELATVVCSILAGISSPRDAGKSDERDASIYRYGEYIGYLVFSIGILGALGLTMAKFAHFWIGNAIYLAFVLAALISTTVKLVAYRRGFQQW